MLSECTHSSDSAIGRAEIRPTTIRLVRVIGDVGNITSPVGAKGIPVARSGPALRPGPNDPITWFDRPARTAGVIRADEP